MALPSPLTWSILVACIALPAAGCTSLCAGRVCPQTDSTASDSGGTSATAEAAADVVDEKSVLDAGSQCIAPGTPNNEKNVGGYCRPGGHECDADGQSSICTADVGQALWFCTAVCSNNADCGSGAVCRYSPVYMQSGCVPVMCLGPADGGSDAQADSPDDGAVE
jgi:hypothetical protein